MSFFFSHPVSFTHLHGTLEATTSAVQHKWSTCVGKPQQRRGMPPNSQTTNCEKRGLVHLGSSPGCPVGVGHQEALFFSTAWDWGPNGSWACALALCSCSEGSQDLWRYLALCLLCPPLFRSAPTHCWGIATPESSAGMRNWGAHSPAFESLLWCRRKDGLISSPGMGCRKGRGNTTNGTLWNGFEKVSLELPVWEETDFYPWRFFQLF